MIRNGVLRSVGRPREGYVRQLIVCDACGREPSLADGYAAEEAGLELEVLVWSCPGCGARTESTTAPDPDERPLVA